MSTLKSDQDFRRAARELGIDAGTLRDLLNTADPDELLQRVAAVVVDNGNSLEEVARIFGVNEKHLGEAVWYMKENRAREEDELLQQAARAVVDDHKEIGAVARIFGVNEEYLGRAVWFMKQNRYRQARSLKSDEDIQRAARRLGIDEKKLRRAMNNGAVWALAADAARSGSPGADYVAEALGLDAEALRSHLRSEREAHRRAEEPKRGRPSWLEYPPS